MQSQYRPRTRGSARFSPYYKVQWYDDSTLAWRDVQRQRIHPSAEQAAAAFIRGVRCRVMEVTMQGRSPLPEAPAS